MVSLQCGNVNCGAYIGGIDFPVLYVFIKAQCPKCGLVGELKHDFEPKMGIQMEYK